MSPSFSQQTIQKSPWQLWRYFSAPITTNGEARRKYGDWIPVHFLGRNFTTVLSSEEAQAVFNANPDMQGAFWEEALTNLTGEGALWVLSGEKHRHERHLYSQAIQKSHLRDYGMIIGDITREHVRTWEAGKTIRAMQTTRAIALDVIIRMVFGVEDENFRREGREILEAVWNTIHPVIVLFPKLHRTWFPLWRRYIQARSIMYDWLARLITMRRAETTLRSDDILMNLIKARDIQGQLLSDNDIRDSLYTILIAGHETTATAMAWVLYELGRNPVILKKVRDELDTLGPVPDPASIVRLPYLTAVCNEALRLHSPVAEVGRVINERMDINGHPVEAGTSLVVSILAIHHDPAIYPQPEKFIPERFLERKYSETEFLPFGGGHRRCLGIGIAPYEMRIAIAEIAAHWEFVPTITERDVRHDVAMGPKYGVPLRIMARRHDQEVSDHVEEIRKLSSPTSFARRM